MNTLPDRSVTHVGKLYCHLCTEVQQLRQKYVHPTLKGDPEGDAMISINLLCNIINCLVGMTDDYKYNYYYKFIIWND